LSQTFDVDFIQMMHMSLFVPFLQEDCPQISSIPLSKTQDNTKQSFLPNIQYVNTLLALRKRHRDAREHEKLVEERSRLKSLEHHQFIKNSIYKLKLKENLKDRVQKQKEELIQK
jgi:hypothetical protein